MAKERKASSSSDIPFADNLVWSVQQLNEMRALLLAEAAELPDTLMQLRDLPGDLRTMAVQLERATKGLEAFIQLASAMTDAAQLMLDARSNLFGIIETQTNRLSRGEELSREMLADLRTAAQRIPDPTRLIPWMNKSEEAE